MKKIIKLMLFLIIISMNLCLIGCSNTVIEKHYNEWVEENGSKYYYNGYGQKQTGWIQDSGYWYYLDPINGKMIKDQWVDKSYYVDGYGRMLINTTKEINGGTYVFDKDGIGSRKPDYELIIDCVFPKTFRRGKYYWNDVIIENVTYKVKWNNYSGNYYFEVYYTGIAGNSSKGSNHSVERAVGWKLYDPNGYAIGSGTLYTDAALKQGERFKNNYTGTCSLEEKGLYRLELINLE